MKKMFTSRFFSAIGTPVLSKKFPLSVWLLFAFANVIQAQTWTAITPPPGGGGFLDIDFIDANNGALALTSGGDVAWTTNGGSTWSKNADIAADMYSVDMVDASTIFAIGGGGNRVRTLNSGSNWDVSNIFAGHFHAGIRFATPSIGWAAEYDGRLYKTINSGTSWTLQTNLGIFGMFVKGYVASTTVAYWPMGTNKSIKKTADGTTWNTVYTAPTANIVCMTGIDANNVWAGLSDGTIVKTTDGGANWTSYSTGVNFQINAIDFVSANEGWLVGAGGRIFYTGNGGVTWTQQTSGTTNDLLGISMVSSNLGFACGGVQTLLKFTNCSAEINLQGGSPLTNIVDGDVTPSTTDGTDFGTVATGSNLARTFTIQNTGTSTLTISSIASSNALLAISGAPASVAAGGSATFTVTFTPTAGGAQTATITVNNNDCDEAVYDFAVTGTGCVPPSFSSCPSSAVTANAGAGQCSAAVSYTVTATGTPTPALTYSFTGATTESGTGTGSGSTFNKGNTTVTVTAVSSCGTSATCTFTVTVVDNEPPAITCSSDVTVNNTPGLCTGTATLVSPVASDNCYTTFGNALAFDGSSDLINIPSGLGQSLNGTNKITVEAMINPTVLSASGQYHIAGDYYGGNPNFKFILRIDTGKKVSFWVGNSQLVGNTVLNVNQWYHVAGTWDGTTMRIYVNGVLDNSKAQGGTFNSVAQITKIGYGALSEYFNGKMDEVRVWNVARTATQIQANYNTMLSAQPNLIALYHFNQGAAGGNNTAITTATDDSGNAYDGTLSTFTLTGTTSNFVSGMSTGVLNVTNNHPSSIYTNGANTVTWTATDATGNTATCEQTVTVLDTEVPVLTAPANQSLNVIANTCAADYTIADPIADICPGSTWGYILSGATTATVSGIADGTGSGAVSFNNGITTVTLTGVDAAGNAAVQQTFTVTVTDNQAPAITCPSNTTANNDAGQCSAIVTFTAPVGTDNCSGPTTAQTGGLASGAVFPVGTTTNTFTVTDAIGLTASCAFTVTVSDNQAPTITCPANITANNDAGLCSAVAAFTAPTGTDNCSGPTTAQTGGLASGAAFPVGVTTNTFTVTAANGQTGTCAFTVTVNAADANVIGNGIPVAAGDNMPAAADGTEFGLVPANTSLSRTFTLQNTGAAALTISSITSSNALFVVNSAPTSVSAGGSANFTVTFSPVAAGLESSVITINSDDCDESVYDFTVQGTGLLCSVTPPTGANVYRWTNGSGNGLWNNAANWLDNSNVPGVPGAGATAFFACSGPTDATLDINTTVAKVIVDASYPATLQLGAQTLSITQQLTVPSAAQLNAGTSLVKLTGSTAITVNTTAPLYNMEINTSDNVQLLQNAVVSNNLTITSVSIMYGNQQIQVSGNVIINDVWAETGGSICTVSLAGSTDQSISGTGNATYLDISKTGGNVLLTDDLGLASGKLTGTGLLKNMGGKVSINNNYAWAFTGTADDLDVNAGTTNNFQLLQNVVVNNNLTITSVSIMYGNKQIQVSGNVVINDAWAASGSNICTISLVGATDQSISGSGNASYLDISKTGGDVLLTDDLGLAVGTLTGTGLLKNMGGKVSINNDYTWAFTGTVDDLDVNVGTTNNFQLLQHVVVNNTLSITSVSIMYGNKQIQVSGNVVINDIWAASGSSICTISLVGATDQSISGGGNASYLDISKTGGDVLLTDDLGLAVGTLTGTGLLKNMGGKVSINNDYTWAFTGTADDLVVNAGSTNNLLLQQDVVVNNTLTISSVNIMYGNKLIRVPGDIIINDGWAPSGASTCFVSLVGTTDQNISGTGPFSYFNYAKPSGDALFNPAFNKTFTSATVTAGTWNTFTGTYTASGGFTATGGNIMGRSTFNGNVSFNTGSSFIPGSSPGCVTINGNLTMNAGSTLNVEIQGFTACTEYDQTVVNGTITIHGATLVTSSPSALYGQAIVFVNDAADAIAGTKFAGAAQGAILNIGGADYKVSYTGGTGNDFTLTSNLPPVAVCQNRTFGIDANCQPPVVTVADINNGSSDPDGDPITVVMSPAGPFALGTTTVTLTVTDIRNATSTCAATVSIVDNTPPTITCPGTVSTNVDAGQCSAVVITTDPVTSDLCSAITTLTWTVGGATGGSSPATGINNLGTYTFSKGINIVTYTVTEAAGNTATCSFNITVIDNIPPTVTCAADVTINNTVNLCTGTTTLTPPTIVDNCPLSLGNALDFVSGDLVTASATILSSSNASQPYTIEFWIKSNPAASHTGGIVSQYSGVNDPNRFIVAITSDNYVSYSKGTTILLKSSTIVVDNQWHHVAFVKSGNGANQLAVYVDGVAAGTGTDATAFQNTNVRLGELIGSSASGMTGRMDELRIWDKVRTPAQIAADMNVEISAQSGLKLLYHFNQGAGGGNNAGVTTEPDASGNGINGILSGFALTGNTSNWVAGNIFGGGVTNNAPTLYPKGPTAVTWTVTDGGGNTVTCLQTVTVVDNQVPVLTAPANQTINTIANTCAANYTIADPIADNCTGSTWDYALSGATTATVTGIADGTGSGAVSFNKGVTTVTLTGVDASGNLAVQKTFTVTINDNIVPTISACPANQSMNVVPGTCSQDFGIPYPTLADNCAGPLTWNAAFLGNYSGSPANITAQADMTNGPTRTFNAGITTVTLSATDASGNNSTVNCTFTVTVIDNQPPVITCASNITVNNTPGLCTGTATVPPPAVTDICSMLGTSLDLDGVNDFVTVPTAIGVAHTIEFWFNAPSPINNSSPADRLFNFSGNGNFWIGTNETASGISGETVNVGGEGPSGFGHLAIKNVLTGWNHIAIVSNGTEYTTIYLNGGTVPLFTNASLSNRKPPVYNITSMVIGKLNTALTTGKFDEIRFWSTQRTQAEIQANLYTEVAPQTGLLAVYHLNEGLPNGNNTALTAIVDDGGSAHNGTLSGFAQTGTTSNWVPGVLGVSYTNSVNGTAIGSGTFPKGVTTVTWTGADAAGNTATCQQTVTVLDNEVPVLTAPANQTVNTIANTCAGSYTIADPITDNCTTSTWGYILSGATTATVTGIADGTGSGAVSFNKGVTTVTLTGVDASGNLAVEKTFTVTVNDNIVPTLTCPANQSINVAAGTCSQDLGIPYPTLADNCAGPLTWNAAFSGNGAGNPAGLTAQANMTNGATRTFNKGATTVTLSATDASGNNSTVNCTFTVTVTDNEPPVITCASNVTVNSTTGLCTGAATVLQPVVSDNCNTLGGSLDLDGVNDFVTVSTGIGTAHTIEFWLNAADPINGTSPSNMIFNFNGNPNWWMDTNQSTSGIADETFTVGGSGSSGFGQLAIKNVLTGWNHIAVVSNGTEYTTIYVNGIPVTVFTNPNISNRRPLVFDITSMIIGKRVGGGFSGEYKGKYDEIRFWSTQRTQAQIQANMNLEAAAQTGLLAVYHCNEGSAYGDNTALSDFVDDAGGAHNGVLSGFAQTGCTSNWTPGVSGVTYINNVNGACDASGIYPKGPTTVTWTATDAAGNTATCQQTVTVLDNEVPVLTAPANQTINTIANTCAGSYTIADPINDNCPGSTWGYTLSGATTATVTGIADGTGSGVVSFNTGITTVTLTGVDASGNLAVEKIFTVTVTDNQAPAITCPANFAVNNDVDQCGAIVTYTAPTGTDNCSGATTAQTAGLASGSLFPVGSTTNTFVVTAANLQTANCSFTVTVTDNQAPVITCPVNIAVNNDVDQCGAVVTFTAPTGTDNCSGATTAQTAGLASGSLFPVGSTTNTFVVTAANLQTANCSFTVTVTDNQAPAITCPANIAVNNDVNECGAVVTFTAPTGTDNCSGATTAQTVGLASGSLFPVGSTTNTFVVTAANLQTANCTFTVTVTDNQAPAITCPANIAVNNDVNECGAVVTFTAPTGTDNCAGATTAQTVGQASGSLFPVGSTTNTFVVTAANGQTANCAFNVTVTDNQAPVITCPSNTVSAPVQGLCSAVVNGIDAVYSDNCVVATLGYTSSGATALSGSGQASGQSFSPGLTTVIYTVTDGVSLVNTCSFTVTMSPCVQISGNIKWENNNAPVKDADVRLEILPGATPLGSVLTNTAGNYTLNPGTAGDYRIRPVKNINILNGVTVADATRIQQHITNNPPLVGAYKRIAADVNKSNSITTYDANLIAQAIAGSPSALLTFNTSWRFVPTSYTFPNPNVPWGFPEKIDFTGLTTSQTNVNFVGVKIGDVNGSSNPQLKPAPPVVWQVEDAVLEAGQPVTLRFAVDHFEDIAAYQFALGFDPAILRYNDMVTSDAIPMNAENIGAFEAETGELRLVWFTDRGRSVKSGTTVFTLHFTAQSSGVKLSDVLQLNDKALQGIAYNAALEERGVALVYRDAQTSGIIDPNQPAGLELLQNVPNPTAGRTTIGFMLPQSCEAQLRILDVNGRLVTEKTAVYPAGYQQETFDMGGHSGVLYYELTTPFGTLVKKMVVVLD